MHKTLQDSTYYLFDNKTITYNQLMVAARKVEGEATEVKGVTWVMTNTAILDENSSELNNMKKELKSMVSKNVNVGRQKGGPQGRNNKGNIVTLDPNHRDYLPIATTKGPSWDGKPPTTPVS